MSWERDKNKGAVDSNQRFGLTTVDSNPGRGVGAAHYEFYELEPAEVIDVILDDTHPDFIEYVDIGKAKVRMVVSENGKERSTLSYAKPLDSNMKTYPLIHEVVIVVQYLSELYYTQRLNVYNAPNQNAVPGISLQSITSKEETSEGASAESYEAVAASGAPNKQSDQGDISLGKIFKENIDIKPLQPFEGDIIYEGRFGQSLRFSSNQESGLPSLKMKVGQPDEVPNTPLQPIEENINDDPSSLWIVNDEEIPLIPATIESETHLQFYPDKPNEFLGNQIFINSDRIVLNSKTQEIMAFAKKAMNLVTEGIFTIDAADDIITNTTSRTILNSPEIYLGGEDAEESVVLGNTLVDLLNELIDILLTHIHPTGTGPSSPMIPPEASQLNQLKSKLESALSQRNYSL
jgi:hypothetical protein